MEIIIHNVDEVYYKNKSYNVGNRKFYTLEIEVTTTDGKSETLVLYKKGDNKIKIGEREEAVNACF